MSMQQPYGVGGCRLILPEYLLGEWLQWRGYRLTSIGLVSSISCLVRTSPYSLVGVLTERFAIPEIQAIVEFHRQLILLACPLMPFLFQKIFPSRG